jgi:hypothetical protein
MLTGSVPEEDAVENPNNKAGRIDRKCAHGFTRPTK